MSPNSLPRILRPGNPIPADIRPFLNRHPDMVDRTCAVVEFEVTAHAHRAVKELNELNRYDFDFCIRDCPQRIHK